MLKLSILVMFLALLACGGGSKSILISYPSEDSDRAALGKAAASLGCKQTPSNKGNLSFYECKKYPDRSVVMIDLPEGWWARCSDADQEECAAMVEDIVAAVH